MTTILISRFDFQPYYDCEFVSKFIKYYLLLLLSFKLNVNINIQTLCCFDYNNNKKTFQRRHVEYKQ